MLIVLNDDVFPQNLVYLRKKRKLSQTKLAQLTGIDVYLLRGIERGRFRSQLQADQYSALCNILHICPSVLGCYDITAGDFSMTHGVGSAVSSSFQL